MTVADLRKALEALPQDAEVYRPDGEGAYVQINRVGPVRGEFPGEPDLFVALDFDPEDLA